MTRLISQILACFVLVALSSVSLAQGKNKKKDQQSANYLMTADDDTVRPMSRTVVYLFPEFYHYWPVDKNDTVLKYECYGADQGYINPDTLHNAGDIWHIYFSKSYTNYMHTYVDADGKPKPSTVSKVIYRYDKMGDGTWKAYDVLNNFYLELAEDRKNIVRRDTTTVMDPITQVELTRIRNYYKVTEIPRKDEVKQQDEDH